jgi:TolA-binding protein
MKIFKNMKKLNKRHVAFIFVMVAAYSFLLVHIAQAVTVEAAEPGTDANPLVSQDYVDSSVTELEMKIDALTTKLSQMAVVDDTLEKQLQQQAKSLQFEIVQVKAGKQVICGASAEFIIRGGRTTVIAGSSGGLSDLIIGKDLLQDVVIPMNHLMLVPKGDNRGFKVVTDAWVLIKGQYVIK